MDYIFSKSEVEKLIKGATEIGYIKGLTDYLLLPKYISQNKAAKIFDRKRLSNWEREGKIVPKYRGEGKTSTKLYDVVKLKELDVSDEIKIIKGNKI